MNGPYVLAALAAAALLAYLLAALFDAEAL